MSAENNALDRIVISLDRKQIAAVDYHDFLARKFPPREVLLAPWCPRAGLAMSAASGKRTLLSALHGPLPPAASSFGGLRPVALFVCCFSTGKCRPLFCRSGFGAL